MKKIIYLGMLLMLFTNLTNYQPIHAQGLSSREEFVNHLSLSLGDTQTLGTGNQYMNDFDAFLSESATSGIILTDVQIRDTIYRLSESYPGWIDHATEMHLTSYARSFTANISNQNDHTLTTDAYSLPNQKWIGDYQSTHAVASISLENVTIPISEYNQKNEEQFVWFLSNKVSSAESFRPDSSHQLTFRSDGSVHHQGTEGFGYEDYYYQGTIGEMVKLGTSRYFFYNDHYNAYDLVRFNQVESHSEEELVFNVDLTRFYKVTEENSTQSSSYSNVTQLHQAFEAYNWITSPEALEAYKDFNYVVENASFGNGSTGTKTEEVKTMVNRPEFTESEHIPLDNRINYILSYPYYRPGGSSAFMQVSYPVHDLYAMGAVLIFYEVTPDMFKPIDYDFYNYNSVNQFVNTTPNIIAVSQYWGNPTDIFQLAIPTINPSTGEQEVSFVIYDNGQIFHYQSVPYSTYREMPAKTNYLNFHDYYRNYKL